MWRVGRIAPIEFTLAMLLSLLSGVAGALVVVYVGRLVDSSGDEGANSFGPGLALAIVVALQGLLPVLVATVSRSGGRRILLRYRSEFVDRLAAESDLSKFGLPEFHAGLQSARLAINTAMRNQIQHAAGLASALVTVALLTGLIGDLSLVAGAALCASVIPLGLADRLIAARQAKMIENLGAKDRERAVLEHIAHQEPFVQEAAVYSGWSVLRARYLDATRAQFTIERSLDTYVLRIEGLRAVAVILLLGATLTVGTRSAESPGQAATVVAAVLMLLQVAGASTRTLTKLHESGLQAEIFERHLPKERLDGDCSFGGLSTPQEIRLRDVWFRYSEGAPWVLRGVDITLSAGTFNVLVGHNGAGKSTLARLACGFLQPTQGTVEWDSVDISQVSPRVLWPSISLIVQEFPQYEYSLREAVVLGREGISDESVSQALELVGLGTGEYANGALDRQLTSSLAGTGAGRRFSGGEWQRLALARALVQPRPVLVADEPNSALDPEAEARLTKALRSASRQGIALAITHRLSSIERGDKMVLLVGGEVVATGDHDHLWRASAEYRDLVGEQIATTANLAKEHL